MSLAGTLGFLGFGNMGSAILTGLIETGVTSAKHVVAFDPSDERRAEAERLGVALVDCPAALAGQCEALMIAVKPQQFEEAASDLSNAVTDRMLVISIMAGVSIERIQSVLPGATRIARVMPNLPAVVNAAASAVAMSEACDEDDRAYVRAVFEAIGIAEFVAEHEMDAVTALSGSGPAYFFYMTECLASAAEAQGLSREVAQRLAGQTLFGAGLLLTKSGERAETLREQVTSKGGTTFAALEAFRANDFDRVITAGIQAATARSKELGA